MPIDAGQTISQPYMVARMTELLAPGPGSAGAGARDGLGLPGGDPGDAGRARDEPGTARALAATARARLDDLGLGDLVEIRVADGSLGDPAGAPYDGIIVTAAAPTIPVELRDQLADGGRLVIPVGPRDVQILTLVRRDGDDFIETPHGACVFVPLIGPGGFPDRPVRTRRLRRRSIRRCQTPPTVP